MAMMCKPFYSRTCESIPNEMISRYVQRLSVYVQIKDGLAKPPSEVDLKDPYSIVRKWKKELSTNGNITSAPFKEKSDDNRHFDNGETVQLIDKRNWACLQSQETRS